MQALALLYVGSVPFDGLPVLGRSVPFIVGSAYLALYVLRAIGEERWRDGYRPVDTLLCAAAFALWCLCTTFWSVAADLSIKRTATVVLLIVTSYALARDLNVGSNRLAHVFVAGAAWVAVAVLLAAPSLTGRRTSFGNANDVALILLLALGAALWLLVESRGWRLVLPCLVLPLFLFAMTATGSRTAAIGAIFLLFVVTFRSLKRRRWRVLVCLGLVVLCSLAFAAIIPFDYLPARLTTVSVSGPEGLGARSGLWEAIAQHGLQLGGVGAGASPAYLGTAVGRNAVAHNVALGVTLETGAIGLMIFVIFLLLLVRDATRSVHSELLAFMMPAVFVASLALSIEASRTAWLLCAFAWAEAPKLSHQARQSPPFRK